MAQLTATAVTDRLPLGNRVVTTFSVTPAAAGQGTDWFDTGFSRVEAVLGYVIVGDTPEQVDPTATTAEAAGANFALNQEGTNSGAAARNGAVGIESTQANAVHHVTVIGIP